MQKDNREFQDNMQFGPTQYVLKKNKVFWFLLVICFVVGLFNFNTIPREWTPDIEVPLMIVSVVYTGASPIDSETLITQHLEREIKGISNIKSLTSTSAEGYARVQVEFLTGTDLTEAKNDLKDAIDKAKPDLPEDAFEPVITEINFSEFPVFVLSLSSSLPAVDFKKIADDIQTDIESIPGVLEASMAGGVEKEMQVMLDPNMLSYYGISIPAVINAISSENRNMPAGSINVGDVKMPVRVPGEFKNAAELGQIVVASINGKSIYLKDVTKEVIFGNKELNSISRIDGKSNISLSIKKRAGENLKDIVNAVNTIIDKSEKKLGDQVTFSVLDDQSIEIDVRLDEVLNTLILGFVLVSIVLMLVMGVLNAIMVAFAIPLSLFMGVMVLSFFGITLNMVVLFSLVMSLGLVVDDAIVVIENIYRHLQMGRSLKDALRVGVAEVVYPVTTSTLTTLAAFFPLLFIPGIMGDFVKYLPITLITTMLSSLVVALFFNPLIGQTFMRMPKKIKHASYKDEQLAVTDNAFYRTYAKVLDWALDNSYKVIFSIVGLFIFVVWFYGSVLSPGVEFFPEEEPINATVIIDTPYGTTLEESNQVITQVEKLVSPYKDFTKNILVTVGSSGGSSFMGGAGGNSISINFPRWQDRKELPSVVISELQDDFSSNANLLPGAKILINRQQSGPPVAKPVNIEIHGNDLNVLKSISNDIKGIISGIPGLINLDDDLNLTQSDIEILPNREQMSQYGISTRDIGLAVRTAIGGTTASKFKLDNDEYDVVVRYPEELRSSVEQIRRIPIVLANRNVIPLETVADVKIDVSSGSIKHVDRNRVATVSGDALGLSGANLLTIVKEKLEGYTLPEDYRLLYTGESKDQDEIQSFMPKAFLAALFLIFILMAWEFNSLVMPLVVLATVFLSLIGVFVGLILHNAPFSILMGGIGVVALAGIVVKNGIVLIDYVGYKREQNIPLKQAIILTCMVRIRPVFLTAASSIFTLLPILLGIDINFFRWPDIISFEADSSAIWKPLANAISYGLFISTSLTLLFVPCMYYLIERKNENAWYKKLWRQAEKSLKSINVAKKSV